MITLGAYPPPETNANTLEHLGQIARYLRRAGESIESTFTIVYVGTFTTDTGVTVTSEYLPEIEQGDLAVFFPTNGQAAAFVADDTNGGVYGGVAVVSPDYGLALLHPNSGTAATFAVIVVRP